MTRNRDSAPPVAGEGHVLDGIGICTRCAACSCCSDSASLMAAPCKGVSLGYQRAQNGGSASDEQDPAP